MRARPILWGGLLAALLLVAAAFLYIRSMVPTMELGVGYAARVACGCRYIGNRPLAQCYKDFEPGMEAISLSEDAQARSVTASVPLLASRTATFDPVLGCQVTPYRGTPYRIDYGAR